VEGFVAIGFAQSSGNRCNIDIFKVRKDKFDIIQDYPLSCFPQGGNDGFVIGKSNVIEIEISCEK
jgi:hypothetical protein